MADPVVFERVIDASLDEAFELFTQPERLRRWQAISASVDLRVGGEYRMTVVPGSIARGEYVEVEPGRRVVYTWGWEGSEHPSPGESTVEVEFEAVGDKTRIRLTHSGLSEEAAVGHTEGWNHYCDRLVDAAAGRAKLDPWHTGPGELDHLGAAEATWAICADILRNVGADDASKSTPCEGFSAHDLVMHLLGSMTSLGGMAGAVVPEEIEASTAEDYLAQAVEPTLAAWRARGTDGEVPFGDGMAPATVPAGILSLEFLIHAWDFAQATDQKLIVEPAVTEFVDGLARAIIQPENRGEGKGFAAETTASSDEPLIALMAFSGRTT